MAPLKPPRARAALRAWARISCLIRALLPAQLLQHRQVVLARPAALPDGRGAGPPPGLRRPALASTRLVAEVLHLHEVLRRGGTLYGDLVAGLLDLLLADLEQDLGGPQVVVDPGLAVDEDVVGLDLAGQVRGALRLEQRGEGQQLGVAVLVERVDRVGDLVLLRRRGRPARSRGRPRPARGAPTAASSLSCICSSRARAASSRARTWIRWLRAPASSASAASRRAHGASHPGAGVLEVVVGGLDLAGGPTSACA